MSKKKRGTPANELYNNHIFGYDNRYHPNPAAQREFAIQRNLERNMTELAMNRFEWTGLENTGIDARFMEMCLFYNGLVVVYWDNDYDKLIAVRGTGTGYVNMLDNPVSFSVIGPGAMIKPTNDTAPAQFHNKTLSAFQKVAHDKLPLNEQRMKAFPVWSNYLRYPDIDTVRIYASRLATVDRTLEINTKNARRTKVLKASNNTQLSAVNAARSLDTGEELLQVTGPLQDMDFLDTLDLGVTPEAYEKLHILRTRWWNEVMNLLGIDGANQDKKERMVSAEVSANDSQTDSMRYVNLNARQQACELINNVFGTNIQVDFRLEAEKKSELKNNMQTTNGGDYNGNVHDENE